MAVKPKKTDKSASKSVQKSLDKWFARFNNDVSPQSLIAEMIGTFLLVSSVLFTSGDAFFTGVTLIVIVFGIFAISGAHANPAVSFGLWTARKISASRMIAYWVAQFVGAVIAILLVNSFAGTKLDLSLASFWSFEPKIFFSEMIGAAVFLFGFAAAVGRDHSETAKAFGIGLSLFLGLIMATGLLSEAVKGNNQAATDAAASSKTVTNDSRLQKVSGVTLNPAVALALTERDASSQSVTGEETKPETTSASRLTIETILGTLIGAAIGANLYTLISERKR